MKATNASYSPYELLEQIGQGSYASVHKAIIMHTGEICAIKKFESTNSDLLTEIRIISNCKSENIVRFLDTKCAGKEVLLVMEYCIGGSVKDVMRHLKITLNIDQITIIVRDVLRGLDYLHSMNKIHRDIKAANILLSHDGVAKLGDFGVSEPLDTNTTNRKRTIIGTLLWLPPEVINKRPNYGTAIDIWSLGITIVEMADGEPPYNHLGESAALQEIKNLDKPAVNFKDPSKWPQELLDLVNLCLVKDASRRKSARDLLSCDLIKSKCPSPDVLKRLVAEASSNINNQSETSLYKKYSSLKKESSCLETIYQHRLRRIIRLDRMTYLHGVVAADFKDLDNNSRQRYMRIKDLSNKLDSMKEEIKKLRREKSELGSRYSEMRSRQVELERDLEKVDEKLQSESRRRQKLQMLESRVEQH